MQSVFAQGRSRLTIFLVTLAVATLGLSACGGGGAESPAASAPTTTPAATSAESTPTISGAPQQAVAEGAAYRFVPVATDINGDALTFSISGKPAWATFVAATGELGGTPSAADVGKYYNVSISVSDGATAAALPAFDIEVVAAGAASGSAQASWTPPARNTDGSALTDLAGYRLYWGTSEGNYTSSVAIDNPGLTRYVLEQLTPGTYFFVLTAVNTLGVESPRSNVASKTVG